MPIFLQASLSAYSISAQKPRSKGTPHSSLARTASSLPDHFARRCFMNRGATKEPGYLTMIELSDEQVAALRAKAAAQGLTLEAWLEKLSTVETPASQVRRKDRYSFPNGWRSAI